MADLDLSIMGERKNVIALIDSDPGSRVIRTRFKKNCEKYGIECFQLKRYSIENYFTIQALNTCFNNELSEEISQINPNEKVDNQLKFMSERNTIKTKNHQIISNMIIDDITDTDLYEFCLKVKEMCES
jgi:hypothetical protein